MLRQGYSVATKLRSLQSTYKSLKGKGSVTSHLSSYAKTLATRTQAAQDKVIDDNYANGVISTQTYLNELQSRSVRLGSTPLQRTNLTIKMRDVQQTYQDEQIQTAYKTGGFFNGNKVDDNFMLEYEKSKLVGMTDSTAYQQQSQKIATIQDKVDKAARTEYRLKTQLQLSQSPDANWQIMEQKAQMYQNLADEAKNDGDNNQYMSFQTTANNYKESASNAKVSAEYQEKLYNTKTETNKNKSDIQFGNQPAGVPAGVQSAAPAGLPNPTTPGQNSTPTPNEDGTVTPGQPAEPEVGILDDISNIDWTDLSPYYTDSDNKSVSNAGKTLENKQKAIQKKIEDANAALEKADAAQTAMDASATYDEKLKYAREMNSQAALYENYVKEATQLNEEFGTAATDVSLATEKKNAEVASRLLADKLNKINLGIDTLEQDVLNGDVSKEEFAVSNAELINAKRGLYELGAEVFGTAIPDETKRIDFIQGSENMAKKVTEAQAFVSNFHNFELVMDADTGGVSPKFVASDKAANKDANGKVLPDGKSAFDVKYQKVGNAYVPIQFRDKKTGKVLTAAEVQGTNLSELSNPKKFNKEGTVWRTVIHEEVDDKGQVVGETPERSPINATFDENGDILDYSYTDADGKVHDMKNIPIQEAGTQQGFLDKVKGVWNAITDFGSRNVPEVQPTTVGNAPTPLNPLRSLVDNVSAVGTQLRSTASNMPNPFEMQKVYAQDDGGSTPTLSGVPEQYSAQVLAAASKYGINPSILAGLIAQESNFDPMADNGEDRGIVQINRAAHPEVSDDQAFDANFAIDWAAKEVSRLVKAKGSEYEGLRAYNAGEAGSASNPNLGKDYANKILERSKGHTVTTPSVEKPTVLADASGLRSQGPLVSNVTGAPKKPSPVAATLKSIETGAGAVGQGVQNAMTGAGNAIRSIPGGVKKEVEKVKESAKKADNTIKTVKAVAPIAKAVASPIIKNAISNVPAIKKVSNTVNTAKSVASSVGKAVSNTYNKVKNKVSSGIKGLRSLFKF